MNTYLLPGLVANAASMGYNWMYNTDYLQKLSLKKSLLFQKPNLEEYTEAGKSYFAYPDAEIGSVSTQGMFMKWLYGALLKNPSLDRQGYETLLYQHIGPGGSYKGYIETYGKKMIMNVINRELKLGFPIINIHDDHLVGFIPYLVCRELKLTPIQALDLASLFTDHSEYASFYRVFDYVFDHLGQKPLPHILLESIELAPKHYQVHLRAALDMENTMLFVEEHAGISCHIPYSVPVIFHLLSHATTFEDLVEKNTKLGGASSDRGLLLGAIMHQISPAPQSWIEKLKP
jgi:hypothetical protein